MDVHELDVLAMRARDGDEAAFSLIVQETQVPLRACISVYAAHPQQVDEVLQDTLVAAWAGLKNYRAEGTLLPWMKQIARNRIRRDLRDRRRFASVEGHVLDAAIVDEQLMRMEIGQSDAAEEEDIERLRNCLGKLPDQVRRLVEFHHFNSLPLAEIAEMVGRSANWVAVRLFRARTLLAECVARSGHAG